MGKEVLQVSENKELKKVELEYEERDGIYYPKIYISPIKYADIGKFGHMWMEFMESAFPIRYRNLVICGELYSRAMEVDEIAWELHEDIEKEWIKKHKPKNSNSFVEIYEIRSQARLMAEEVVMHEVVNCYH